MRRGRGLAAIALGGVALALLGGPAQARPCTFYSAYGPGVYDLGQGGFDDTYVQHVKQAGLAGLRVNFRIDTEATWDDRIFAAYDQMLARARGAGLHVLGLVGSEVLPDGQAEWNAPPISSDGQNGYTQRFVDVTRLLFARYGDQIKEWEIWNEPNACTSCGGDPASAGGTFLSPGLYAKLLAEIYVQNRELIETKGLHLISGGLYAHDLDGAVYAAGDYMEQVFGDSVWDWLAAHLGRRYPWDGFGFHIYTTLSGPPVAAATVSAYLDDIAAVRANHGDGSPIWMTEFGWQTATVSEAQQAEDLDTELTVLESRDDIGRTFVFRVDEWQTWGIYRADWTAKPAVAVVAGHAAGCEPVPLPALPGDLAAAPPGDLGIAGGSDGGEGVGGGGQGGNAVAPTAAGGCSFGAREGAQLPGWLLLALLTLPAARRAGSARRCRAGCAARPSRGGPR